MAVLLHWPTVLFVPPLHHYEVPGEVVYSMMVADKSPYQPAHLSSIPDILAFGASVV